MLLITGIARDVQDCQQRLSSAFDLLLILLCSLIQTLTLTPPPNNAMLAILDMYRNCCLLSCNSCIQSSQQLITHDFTRACVAFSYNHFMMCSKFTYYGPYVVNYAYMFKDTSLMYTSLQRK